MKKHEKKFICESHGCEIRHQNYFVSACPKNKKSCKKPWKSDDPVKLFVQDYGHIDAKTIVFPDGNISPQGFTYQITPLVEAGFRVVIINPRGMGLSDKPFGPYSLDVWADDLASVIDQLDLKDIILVGSTPLSRISLRYITRHDCDRVSCLFFHSPNANPTANALPLPLLESLKADIRVNRENTVNSLTQLLFFPTVPTAAQVAWLNALQLQLPVHVWLAFFDSLVQDMTAELSCVCAPVLGIIGENDQFNTVDAAQAFVDAVPDGDLIVVPGQGHLLQITDPTAYNNALIDFAKNCNAKECKKNHCKPCGESSCKRKLCKWENGCGVDQDGCPFDGT